MGHERPRGASTLTAAGRGEGRHTAPGARGRHGGLCPRRVPRGAHGRDRRGGRSVQGSALLPLPRQAPALLRTGRRVRRRAGRGRRRHDRGARGRRGAGRGGRDRRTDPLRAPARAGAHRAHRGGQPRARLRDEAPRSARPLRRTGAPPPR